MPSSVYGATCAVRCKAVGLCVNPFFLVALSLIVSFINIHPFLFWYPPAPDGAPQNLTVAEVTSTTSFLSWLSPDGSSLNGIVTNYTVKYILESNSSVTFTAVTDGNATNITLTELEKYSNYTFSVQVNNRVGAGPFSDELAWMTDEHSEWLEILLKGWLNTSTCI